MKSLARRMEELTGLCVRLHVGQGRIVTVVDGVCQGIQDGAVVLDPSSAGARTAILLEQVYAVTQLPGQDGDWAGTEPEASQPVSLPDRPAFRRPTSARAKEARN